LATRRAAYSARSDDIRGIVLSPTRELAEQIAVEARRLTKHTGLVVQSAVGGTHKASMLRQTKRQGCHLLVATPGRLNDLLQDPTSGIAAPNLASLVLDEADRMLDVGFEDELTQITRNLPPVEEKVRQTLLVSATIPDNVIRLARTMVRANDFEFVQTISENESLTHDRVPQNMVRVGGWNDIFPTLFELIDREQQNASSDHPFKAIVYFNTTALVQLSNELGFHRRRNGGMRTNTYSIHSGLTQGARTKAADSFRRSKNSVLFSSDVTARGMDFPDVTHVIQIDTPRDRESYIHRLGRTARQGKDGEGWIILPPGSANSARSMLRGLPIEPNETLTCATADEATGLHDELREIFGVIDRDILVRSFTSIFGGKLDDRYGLVRDMNKWATEGWGWSEPPSFGEDWVRKMALVGTDINIRAARGPRFGNSDSRDARGSRGSFNSSDPFDNMSSQIHRDSFGADARKSGSSRGFRGSRGRGSSRSSGRDSRW
jgi:ATP-dependent RNA helicase MSS116